jgi:hypothetical protein
MFACATAVSLWLPHATASRAETGMEWQFFETNNPDYKSTRLVYGVPETDNVQVSGACVHSASIGANFSTFTFGADIGALEAGKDTELRLSGGGFDHTMKGKIVRAAGEEGLSGVELDIGTDDPLWRAFAEKDSIDYLVPGYKAASLDFSRGRDKIQQFVKACETFATGSQPAQSASASGDAEKEAFESAKELGTVEAWEAFLANYSSGFRADLARAYIKKLGATEAAATPPSSVNTLLAEADASCKDRGTLRSQNSNTPVKITFINRAGAVRGIVWLDFNGQPKDYATLNDREQITLDSFMTHPWMITDGPGDCLRIVLPQSNATAFELGSGSTATTVNASAPAKEIPAKKPVAKKVTGCEEGYKLVKGKCKRITSTEKPQGCPAGTRPVPETDNCVPITSKSGCPKGQIKVEGKCMTKSNAVSYCGPGYRPQGGKCVQGYVAPKNPRPSTHGSPPGQVWNAQEGCHEDD